MAVGELSLVKSVQITLASNTHQRAWLINIALIVCKDISNSVVLLFRCGKALDLYELQFARRIQDIRPFTNISSIRQMDLCAQSRDVCSFES